MRAFFARLRDLFRRRTIAQTFDEEMSFHLAQLEESYRARGATPAEARIAATRAFGNDVRAREDLRTQAGFPSWDELINDFRHAWRGIVRRPTLACSVVIILALGLGAAATIHGLIDTVFLRPLPVTKPEELHAVLGSSTGVPNRLSRGTVRRLEEILPPDSVAAYNGGTRCTVQVPGQDATRVSTRLVNGSFFASLGVGPSAGRLLSLSDDIPGAPANVVVVGNAWARKTFGTPESAVGREIIVNRVSVVIVGVLPTTFSEIAVGQVTDLWFAAAIQPRLRAYGNSTALEGDDRPNDPDWNREERVSWMYLLVRVRPGGPSVTVALQRAWETQRDDMALAFDDPQEREQVKRHTWQLVPAPGGQSRFRDSFRSTGFLLGGVVAVMLVLVCTNVSGLLLVRSMSRHREIGIRLALGAGSFRVVRLSFFEAAILSTIGGAGGFLLATWLLPAAARLLAPGQDLPVALSLNSVLFMSGLSVIAAALSALTPALWISRVQPLNALSGTRGLGRAPICLGRVLVVGQFAIAVVLVAIATTLGDELQRTLAMDPGFARAEVMTAIFDPASAGYSKEAILPLVGRMREVALGVPGVSEVSFSSSGILAGSQTTSTIYARDPRARRQQGNFPHDVVLPGYFGVVGVPLLIGRDFAETDTLKAQRAAVVSAAFARDVFGDVNPIGQAFGFDVKPSPEDWIVVGVAADVRANGVREKAPPLFYTTATQSDGADLHFLAVRFMGPEAALQTNLRAALARAEPGLVLTSWKTLQKRMTDDLSGALATSQLAAIFGACAVLLAGAGVAGSLGYLVVLRQRELALRMAIGAEPARVLRGVLGDAVRLSLVGSTFGLLAVWLVQMVPAAQAVLSGQPGISPALIAAAIALFAAVVAGWFPARRAARIDPIMMLRSE